MKHLPLLLLLCLPLTGCLVSKKEHDKILEENRILKVENEELQNGEERSAARIENLFEEGNLSDTKRMIERFFEYHPHSSFVAKFKTFLEEIELKEIEIAEQKAADQKERLRLANINNTGNWYVFEGYYAKLPKVNGLFDNSATENSRCSIEFQVTDEQRVEMKIYEYAGTNPLKATYRSPDVYRVLVLHGEKEEGGRKLDYFTAKNTSKYLEVDEEGSNFIIQKLLEEESLGFWITGTEYNQNSQYRFELKDFEYFENALRKLLGE